VDKKADKLQIKSAIEKLYNVKVVDVRTVNVAGKPKRTRAGEKTTSAWKKAVVKLHSDHKIDLF
jgi:large subunit ribosomal protein L23